MVRYSEVSIYRGSFFTSIFYFYWGKENHSLSRGLRYIEVRYIEVPLYCVLGVPVAAVAARADTGGNSHGSLQPSPQAFSARSFLYSTISCDVNDRCSPALSQTSRGQRIKRERLGTRLGSLYSGTSP